MEKAVFRDTNSLPRKTHYVLHHFHRSYFKAKVKGRGKLNMRIIFESVPMLFTQN